MDTIKPVSFYIQRSDKRNSVIAVMSNGEKYPWGTQLTERGLKMCLTRYAKRCGFAVTGETAQAAE